MIIFRRHISFLLSFVVSYNQTSKRGEGVLTKSYVIASAVSELYVLIMMSLIGYLTFYLA